MTNASEQNRPHSPLLVVLLGPTGVGKTAVSLSLAKRYQASVVSSDSRQIYREIPIGTAAPTADEMVQVPHYFIATHTLTDQYSAGQYELDVLRLLAEEIFPFQQVAILSGGSMMYVDAVCKGLDDIPSIQLEIRAFWQQQLDTNGLEFLQHELQRLDPVHYEEVDLKNYKRVMHALEVCTQTGKPFSELRTGVVKPRSFQILKIGLNRPRAELYERINLRVDQMMEQGLLEEAQSVYPLRHLNSLNTVGYKELFEYFDGNWPLDFAIQMIKQNSRRYAKRQLTWYNRDTDIRWFHPDAIDDIMTCIDQTLAE
ncbi:MAG: tRNA (adenosine(37)-N6)-dimethylallyltransferase MiaA [Paludibacter sp.]|jgi:tRNA dimethylallyltransferase|nr:tRNA (adenosine(37)-N6)-dimethylallyltransferase MiaA [Paludibacter sp.]